MPMIRLLASLQGKAAPPPLEPSSLHVGGEMLRVVFRRHATARRLVLRLEPGGSGLVVTVPKGVSRARALDFVERSGAWVANQLRGRGQLIHLLPGQRLALRGIDHEIRHVASRRGLVTTDPLQRLIHVPGEAPYLKRRLLAFLKAEARAELIRASSKYAGLMGVSFRKITLRDQKSRWGSCSPSGELSYSWRLILTPDFVLDYVAAHEVAHLRHLNHGPRFWRLVLSHCPQAAEARDWLRANGQQVHRVVT
jgi:predicted metal-dependent hydrolase